MFRSQNSHVITRKNVEIGKLYLSGQLPAETCIERLRAWYAREIVIETASILTAYKGT